jgi:hypothetical protein
MADDASTRGLRHRKHTAGDHSMCRERSCEALKVSPAPPAPGESIEGAVRTLVAQVHYDDLDPRSVTALIAIRLAAELDAGRGSVQHAQALRGMVQDLAAFPDEQWGFIDTLRARISARRVEKMIGGQPIPGIPAGFADEHGVDFRGQPPHPPGIARRHNGGPSTNERIAENER